MIKAKKNKKTKRHRHTQPKFKIIYNISPNQSLGSLDGNIKGNSAL